MQKKSSVHIQILGVSLERINEFNVQTKEKSESAGSVTPRGNFLSCNVLPSVRRSARRSLALDFFFIYFADRASRYDFW